MLDGVTDLAAVCVGLLGLVGAAATTGMPMWKVTAFIEENIIVMETRWEGLWMNCFRQANIRMQCKVYDSLLFLPPELQAARGLMCCSLALSGLGLMLSFAGLRCVSCLQENARAKALILMAAGVMQLMASICVFIPVSWTGHVIIRDFYNPLLIDAQRRELGEALYIGWVTGAVLFTSAMLFLCRRVPKEGGSFDIYHPAVNLLRYQQNPNPNPAPAPRYHPLSTISSLTPPPPPPSGPGPQPIAPLLYNPGFPESGSLQRHLPSTEGSSRHPSIYTAPNSLYTPGNTLYMPGNSLYTLGNPLQTSGNPLHLSQGSVPMTRTDPSTSYQSSFYPAPQTPVFVGYSASIVHRPSVTASGMYI